MKKALIFSLTALIALASSATAYAKDSYNVSRLAGSDRYKTSVNISKSFNNDIVQTVILANGQNFPDALSGSLLSKKYNAPILLSGSTPSTSSDALDYIKSHLSKDGTVYVLGGTASISEDLVNHIKQQGNNNVLRLGGQNRFNTGKVILDTVKVPKGTPVILANGYGFADTLSASSISAIKDYPILMTTSNTLPIETKAIIDDIQPSQLYVIGGTGVVSDNVVEETKAIAKSLSPDKVTRIPGNNRYDTSINICKYFNLDSDTIVLASGENFPDALSGSALAIKSKAPIILTNGQDILAQKSYIDSKNFKNIILLGGTGSIDIAAEYSLKGSNNISQAEKDFIQNLSTYCDDFYINTASTESKFIGYSKNITKIQNSSNINSVEDVENILNQFSSVFNDMSSALNDYKETLVSLQNKVSNIDVPENLKGLKADYIKNINAQTANIDKVTNSLNTYSGLIKSFSSAVRSRDLQQMDDVIATIRRTNDELSKFSIQSMLSDMNKLSAKIQAIKNAMN